MRNVFVGWIVAVATVLAWSPAMFAQAAGAAAPAKTPAPQTQASDPHDLSGVWVFKNNPSSGVARQAPHATFSLQVPPMTPWAKAKYDANIPGYGPKAFSTGVGNDPVLHCDPAGFPKTLVMDFPFEMAQIRGRWIQFLENQHEWREIWTDGRAMPKDADPTWYGTSVGKWDGDTLVVETAGVDDRSWLDMMGNPHSDALRVTERYRRLNHETLLLDLTINDAKAYTKPWVAATRVYTVDPKIEIEEDFCVPSEEDYFTKKLREPAGGLSSDTKP